MKQSELPRCPECGNMPEWALKADAIGMYRGSLKCPYNCHHVSLLSYGPAGSRKRAEEILTPQWITLVEKINRENAQ